MSEAAAADGSTLKVSAPTVQSPVNNQTITGSTLTLVASAAVGKYATVTLQYRFQILTSSGSVAQEATVSTTSWQADVTKLTPETAYTWRVRAEAQGAYGPWSSSGSFISPDPALLSDPLTNGKTIGVQHGGHFVSGQGWMADGYADGIDYDIPICSSCTLEFDATNFGKGLGNPADLKWISMGDATAFGDFGSFRDHIWKMHLEQRGDGDGTAMKLIWRSGTNGPGTDPGDHVDVEPPSKFGGPNWNGSTVYHFILQWNAGGYSITIQEGPGGPSTVWFQGSFAQPYAPPNHRISLGCYPRNETQVGAIWRNVKLTKQ